MSIYWHNLYRENSKKIENQNISTAFALYYGYGVEKDQNRSFKILKEVFKNFEKIKLTELSIDFGVSYLLSGLILQYYLKKKVNIFFFNIFFTFFFKCKHIK